MYYKSEYILYSLKYRLVPNYGITKQVLVETKDLIGKKQYRRIIRAKQILIAMNVTTGRPAALADDKDVPLPTPQEDGSKFFKIVFRFTSF